MWQDEYQPKWTIIFVVTSMMVYLLQKVTSIEIYLVYIPRFTLVQPWTLLTAIFLHIDLNHLLFNMLALFIFGSILEKRIGNRPFVVLFILSGLVGNSGYFLTAINPMTPVLGASGAIYGVVGALAVLEPYRVVYLYGLMPLPMVGAAILWALGDLKGLFTPSNIAHGAHLAGMLVGFLFGLYLKDRQEL